MAKLDVVEKEDEWRVEDIAREITKTDMRQITDVFSWRSNQILCNCWWWAKIFSIMRRLDQSTWRK